MANKLIFKDAEAARDAIMASQKKEIADLYEFSLSYVNKLNKVGQMRLVRERNTSLTNPLQVLQYLSDTTKNCKSN